MNALSQQRLPFGESPKSWGDGWSGFLGGEDQVGHLISFDRDRWTIYRLFRPRCSKCVRAFFAFQRSAG